MPPRKKPQAFEPWAPPPTELPDVAAIKALARGDASPEQQRHALKFIVEKVCGAYEEQFCPGEDGRRATDYALGKRRVGLYIVTLLAVDIKRYRDPDAPPRETV